VFGSSFETYAKFYEFHSLPTLSIESKVNVKTVKLYYCPYVFKKSKNDFALYKLA